MQPINLGYVFLTFPNTYFLSTIWEYISACLSTSSNGLEAPNSEFLCYKSSLLLCSIGPCMMLWENIYWVGQVNSITVHHWCVDICTDFSTSQSTFAIISIASLLFPWYLHLSVYLHLQRWKIKQWQPPGLELRTSALSLTGDIGQVPSSLSLSFTFYKRGVITTPNSGCCKGWKKKKKTHVSASQGS